MYRCDSNNSECREGAAPERGEQAEHRQKETLKEGNGLCSSPCSSAAPGSAGLGCGGTPILQTAGYPLILLRLCRVCTGKLRWTHPAPSHPGYFPLRCPRPARGSPNAAVGLPAEPPPLPHQQCLSAGTDTLSASGLPPPPRGRGLSVRCPREIPARTMQVAASPHIRTADFLVPARGLGTGLEDFVSIVSPAPAPRGFALWAWRASW